MQVKLQEAYEALIANQAAIREYSWEISRDGVNIYVTMRPRKQPHRQFTVRIQCDDFPVRAPSYQFVSPKTLVPDPSHMPKAPGFMPHWPGVCINGTREFYEKGHPERRNDWSFTKYPFATVLQEMQVLIDQTYK
jgi:hypothetical protein